MPKPIFLLIVSICVSSVWADAPRVMYKCDNLHYTDSLSDPKAKGCKPLEATVETVRPKPLSEKQRGQFRTCQLNATKAPTDTGVRVGLMLCNQEFEQ